MSLNFLIRIFERTKRLTKRAISKSVVISRFTLTVYINLRYFSETLAYSFIYTNNKYNIKI